MFAKTIIDSDAFLEMPISARLLYYDLAMRADDDGFINSPKKIMKMIGATPDDMSILIVRKFIIPFENGIVVIKHWRIHNYIRKDTYNETPYKEERALLEYDENKAYKLKDDSSTERVRLVDDTLTQVRIGKDRLGKDRIEKREDCSDKSEPAPSKRKTKYGEFKNVSLTEEELDKLKTEHGSQETEEAIRILDEYMETSGKKYKSCYLALKKWGFRAVAEQGKKQKTKYDEVDEWLAQQNNSQ